MTAIPPELGEWDLALEDDGHVLCYEFDANAERTGVPSLLRQVSDLGIGFKDLATEQSSLEDIFVGLVHEDDAHEERRLQRRGRARDLPLRNGARAGAPCGRAWSPR